MIGSDNDPIFNTKNPDEKYIDTLILLGDKIYDKNVPNVTKGEFFKYKVGKYYYDGKKFKLHFTYQANEP